MSITTQFYLLQYKNWKLQFRKKLTTIFEILIPVILCLLMVAIRTLVDVTPHYETTTFPAFKVDGVPEALKNRLTNPKLGLWGTGIAYTPKTNITDRIINRMKDSITAGTPGAPPFIFQVYGCSSEQDLEEYLKTPLTIAGRNIPLEEFYLGGIVFENPTAYSTGVPHNISYTIRPPFSPRSSNFSLQLLNTWATDYLYVPFDIPGPRDKNKTYGGAPGYYEDAFLTLQHALHQSVINEITNESVASNLSQFDTLMQRFPYPPYVQDLFLVAIQTNLPFFIMLCMIFYSLSIPKEVTLEKERKLKESMRMMGMSNWLQWLSWFVKYFVFLLFTTFLMAFILCPPFKIPEEYTVLKYSSFTLIWLFFMLYAVSLICYSFMISVFFSKANSSAAAGGIIFFLSYLPFSFISPRYGTLSAMTKLVSCLDLNMAMSLGMVVIGKFEGTAVGVQWDNWDRPVTVDDNISFSQILLMFVADSFLYIIIMWYVEAVFPGDYGIPQRPWFLFLPSYWCGTKQDLSRNRGSSSVAMDTVDPINSGKFESEPQNLQAGIQIRGLTKKFKGRGNSKEKVAVNRLNLNMYDGQITALLGHNGAGKTTTMFMLTGFMPPTSGTALINGYDITQDIANVRASLGLCPQHDILFDELTVEEHLFFFAKLKRCPPNKIATEITYYVKQLGLEEKRHAYAKTLSGGQKRKLSVGIALIGDSKIVILDEPTSGMDPSARRHMWDVLQEQRKGRTMILSTHFMDEADHLGDRIAILSDGVVQCCGSSLFLKKKYGAGYHMVMTKTPECDTSRVHEMLTKHIPEAMVESNVGAELSYILPDSKVSSFPDLFAELEENLDALGILGFGASVTTMEEVFRKVGEQHDAEEEERHANGAAGTGHANGAAGTGYSRLQEESVEPSSHEDVPMSIRVSDFADADHTTTQSGIVNHAVEKNTGLKLAAQQFYAMLLKRMIYTWRNKILTLSQIVLPLLFTIITIAIIKTLPGKDGTSHKLPFTLEMYGKTTELYSGGLPNTPSEDVAKQFDEVFSHSARESPLMVNDPAHEIIVRANQSMKAYNFELILAADYNSTRNTNGSDVTVLFNAQPYHAAPTAILYADTALLKAYTNDSYTFAAAIHPLNQSTISKINSLASSFNGSSFAYSANLMFGFSFLAASFVVFLITERSRRIKHSQIVSGVKWYNFWFSTFCWDFINYIIPALLTVCLFAIFDVKNLADITNGNAQPGNLIVLMLMYGLAFLPSMYLIQFAFTGPATGYVVVAFFNLLTGTFPQLVVTILKAIASTKDAADVVDWVFIALLPNYNMGVGVSNLYTNYQYQDLCYTQLPEALNRTAGKASLENYCANLTTPFPCCKDNCGDNCFPFQENYFAWESLGIGRSLVFLAVQMVLFWAVVIIIESEVIVKFGYLLRPKVYMTSADDGGIQVGEDEDVAAEREKIEMNSALAAAQENQVVISGLTKYFGVKTAVDDMHVTIPNGECFGLLGVNGAGKTTTFKMLTGDETISGGTAYMAGKNIRSDIHEVQKSIGYCPQFDALVDQMTGEEMLYMYARLRGVPEAAIPAIVDDVIKALLLDKHRNKLTREYSGGNKRKLSTAIALMGDPPIVFLDEPTTGMDPVAKRMLWEALSKVRDSGKTLILTSHSMEECEALCTRMAIMVNGKYKCLGSTQHLKNKFGAGYTLIARVSYPEDGSMPDIGAVQTFVEDKFPGSVLKDKHQNLVQYQVPKGEVTWADIFRTLEENKLQLNIEDYLVSQTSLEQVFIFFARSQIDPEEEQSACCARQRGACCFLCTPEYVKAPIPNQFTT